MQDDDIMPFGKHKGEKMANVPASYLIWLYENDKAGFGEVLTYIKNGFRLSFFHPQPP